MLEWLWVQSDPLSPRLLRVWLFLIGSVALVTAAQSFLYPPYGDPVGVFRERIYTRVGENNSGEVLHHRTCEAFGAWTGVSGVLRVCAAVCGGLSRDGSASTRALYQLAMWSFLVAFGFFAYGVGVSQDMHVDAPGVLLPLLISTWSFLWMVSCYSYFLHVEGRKDKEGEEGVGRKGKGGCVKEE
eukprot:Nk52_evm1s876 gene=Nk52_evmTU1s876